jgi:hypothetical protein
MYHLVQQRFRLGIEAAAARLKIVYPEAKTYMRVGVRKTLQHDTVSGTMS